MNRPATLFTVAFLQAVNDWQRGGDENQNRRRGVVLRSQCLSLLAKYRESPLVCHRQIALPKGGVWDLLGEGKLTEKVSSWTLDLEVAKDFKGGVPPKDQGFQGAIFSLAPPPGSVIVNISLLYRDPEFLEAVQLHKEDIVSFHRGIGLYGDRQREVVLEIDRLSQEDIYSLGGHSSQFEELVQFAAGEIYGRSPTEDERTALILKSDGIRSRAGPTWLTPESTKRVLARVRPAAEILAEIKRNQSGA